MNYKQKEGTNEWMRNASSLRDWISRRQYMVDERLAMQPQDDSA
jgi:hypothetical protein